MNPPEIKYFPYDIKLKNAFSTSGGVLSSRKGFFIKISGRENENAWGEAAPLPEFGSESFNEAESKLKAMFGLASGISVSVDPETFNSKLQELNSFPALRHGLEQAWLNFKCLKEKTSLDRLLKVKLNSSITINGLIGLHSPEEVLIKGRELYNEGFRTLKLKAGRSDFSLDKKCLRLLRNQFSDRIKLRIDVNGKWNFPDAVSHLKELEEFSLEYVEQPVAGKEDFFNLQKISKVPLAADEIIRNINDVSEAIKKAPGIVLVLKPMMLGGLTKTLQIIKDAEASGVKTVISSSFETSIGRSAAIFLASSLSSGLAHGLGTKGFLEGEPFNDPFELNNGVIEVDSSKLNSSWLHS